MNTEVLDMNIKEYLRENHISVREMSVITSIPYSTLNDIVNRRVNLEECQYRTLKKIAAFLKISIEELVYENEDFQTFRNKLHHDLKSCGEVEVILEILEKRKIDYYLLHEDMLKAMYLLSLVDYLSKQNEVPLCKEYAELRKQSLKEPYYVGDQIDNCNYEDCIQEFVKHNIYEGELYDAV